MIIQGVQHGNSIFFAYFKKLNYSWYTISYKLQVYNIVIHNFILH